MREVCTLMQYFPGSFINAHGDVVLVKTGNVYFHAEDNMNREDVLCKICEYVSRDAAKGQPFGNANRNREWRDSLSLRLSAYIGKVIMPNMWYIIYDRLGNGVNHELTLKFVRSGFNMDILMDEGKKAN